MSPKCHPGSTWSNVFMGLHFSKVQFKNHSSPINNSNHYFPLSKNINQGPVPTPQGHLSPFLPFPGLTLQPCMSLRPKVSDSRPSVFTSFFPLCPSACDPESPPQRRSQELTRKARTLPFPPVSSPGSPHPPSAASHQAESKIKARTSGR